MGCRDKCDVAWPVLWLHLLRRPLIVGIDGADRNAQGRE